MSMTALIGARILIPDGWVDHAAVLVDGGQIVDILPLTSLPDGVRTERVQGGSLVPGFIDTQVNGGGGVLFNDQPSVDGVTAIAEAHRSIGTTALLPTLISDDPEVVACAIAAVDTAIAIGVPGVVGIHIEGPYLNSAKRGIHDSEKFRTLDEQAVSLLSSLRNGRTLVTLAPECAPPGMIRALVDRGVVVSAGHSLATYEEVQRAVDEGLTGVTHLFNAMSQMEGRAPGIVGSAMAGNLTAGLIADGHHVHPAAMIAAHRACGPDRLMLVSDAMPNIGTDLDRFMLGKTEIFVRDGALRSADGILAGADLDMGRAVRNAVHLMDLDLVDAAVMASATPARHMGLGEEYGVIAPGARADLVHLDDALFVQRVWVGGD